MAVHFYFSLLIFRIELHLSPLLGNCHCSLRKSSILVFSTYLSDFPLTPSREADSTAHFWKGCFCSPSQTSQDSELQIHSLIWPLNLFFILIVSPLDQALLALLCPQNCCYLWPSNGFTTRSQVTPHTHTHTPSFHPNVRVT